MFTQNYINFRHNMFFGVTGASSSRNYFYGKNIKSCLGKTLSMIASSQNALENDVGTAMFYPRCYTFPTDTMTGSGNYGVHFGTGSTPATLSDYKLESPIESGLSLNPSVVAPVIASDGNGEYSIMATYNVSNTTDADINIYEVGAFTGIQSGTSVYHYVLMERTVLTEPITIPAGESKPVTYKITFNQTLNVE